MLILSRGRKQQPPVATRAADRFGATFLWNANAPDLNLVNGSRAAAIGVRRAGVAGVYRDLSANAAIQSFTTALPQAKYTALAVLAAPTASITFSQVFRCNAGGFRMEPQTTASGVWQATTHTGVANLTTIVTSITLPFDSAPWVYVVSYDGTTARQYLRTGAGAIQTASDAVGYSAPSGTLDIGNTAASLSLYGAMLVPRALAEAEIRSLLDNWPQIYAPAPRRIWAPSVGVGDILMGQACL